MKASIRYPPWTNILNGITLGVFLSMMFAPVVVAGDLTAFCDKNPTHHKCTGGGDGGDEGQFQLTITYEFGEQNDGECTVDCVSSTVTAIGTRQCDEQGRCNFDGSNSELSGPFYLPESLISILDAMAWKGTDLDPGKCFGLSASADPNGRGVELAYDYQEGTWFTAIGSYALDVDGILERKYVFYFLCDTASCDIDVSPPSMAGSYVGGRLLRIEADPRDRGGKSIPCRCTISSEPPCPGEAVVPLSITVEEVPLD